MIKVDNDDSNVVLMSFIVNFEQIASLSSVFNVHFEQVIARWVSVYVAARAFPKFIQQIQN